MERPHPGRRVCAEVLAGSAVASGHRAPADYPCGKRCDVPTVTFTVAAIPCPGLNDGLALTHSAAFFLQTMTEDQAEIDRYENIFSLSVN